MTFEAYLNSKKINSQLFREKEPEIWALWEREFSQMHPNSFTAQKLYLLNPVRRKYLLKPEVKPPAGPSETSGAPGEVNPSATKPKPVMKQPKPVVNTKPKT